MWSRLVHVSVYFYPEVSALGSASCFVLLFGHANRFRSWMLGLMVFYFALGGGPILAQVL
jgi:hypothetical protein